VITGVKTHWIDTFHISLESSWNVDVRNGLVWPIWTPKTQVMVKRKVGNRSNFLVCRCRATYRWKVLGKGYNFTLDVILIRGLKTKLWAPKVVGVPTLEISGLPVGSPGTKCHLDAGLWASHIVYYTGEGGGFDQVRAVMNLMNPSLPVAHPNMKSDITMH